MASTSFSVQEILNRVFDAVNNVLSIGGNVKFPATQVSSTNANTLDDYEEGSWTPALSVATPGTGITYSVQVGRYVKTGKVVHIQGKLTTTSLGGGSGAVALTGLPFTTENTTNSYSSVQVANASGLAITAGQSLTGYIDINATTAPFEIWSAITGIAGLAASEWTDDGSIVFSGTYIAAA